MVTKSVTSHSGCAAERLVGDEGAERVGHHHLGVGADRGLDPGPGRGPHVGLLEVGRGLGQQPVVVVLGEQLGEVRQVDVGVEALHHALDAGDGGRRVDRRLVASFGVLPEQVAVEGDAHLGRVELDAVPGHAVGQGREPAGLDRRRTPQVVAGSMDHHDPRHREMLAQVQPDAGSDLDLEPAGSNSSATSIDVKAMKNTGSMSAPHTSPR